MRDVYVYDEENEIWKLGYGISGLEKGNVFGIARDGKPHVDDEGYTAYRVLSDPYLLSSNTDRMYCVDVQPLEEIEFKEEKIEGRDIDGTGDDTDKEREGKEETTKDEESLRQERNDTEPSTQADGDTERTGD